MVAPVRVTAEATRAFSLLLPVFGVAALAIGVLGDRVQALQAGWLMATAAGWRPRAAIGAVSSMAVVALLRQLAMG